MSEDGSASCKPTYRLCSFPGQGSQEPLRNVVFGWYLTMWKVAWHYFVPVSLSVPRPPHSGAMLGTALQRTLNQDSLSGCKVNYALTTTRTTQLTL